MSTHPLNLAVRFVLELVLLHALARWGAYALSGGRGLVLATALVLLLHYAASYDRVGRLLRNQPLSAPRRLTGAG